MAPSAHAITSSPAATLPKAYLWDLGVTPVAEAVRRLSADGRTGELLVRTGRTAKMVFFDRGRIVFAASNARKDRFGDALRRMGVISDREFTQASALMSSMKVRFGDALIAAGIMSSADLALSVNQWAEGVVISLFDVRTGTAFFEARRCTIPAEYAVELAVDRVLHDGIATMTSHEMVLQGLGNLDRRVATAAVPRFPVETTTVDLLNAAKKPAGVRDLVTKNGRLSSERLRAAYGLLASGFLVEAGRVQPQPVPAPPPDPAASLRREVAKELERSQNLDPKTWLDLSMSAPRDKIVRALEQRMEKYQELRASASKDVGIATDVELLLGRVSSTLRLNRPAPPAPATPAPPASATPTPARSSRPAQPEGPAAAPPAAPNSSMDIEHLLMEADIRMSVSDFGNAARAYAKVVELKPNVAIYRMRLATAMSRSPALARQAEGEFLEAIRLDPKNADLHFRLGLYYKAMKVRSRYIAEIRTTLELDPRHAKARAESEGLTQKDFGLGGLKKLLG